MSEDSKIGISFVEPGAINMATVPAPFPTVLIRDHMARNSDHTVRVIDQNADTGLVTFIILTPSKNLPLSMMKPRQQMSAELFVDSYRAMGFMEMLVQDILR